MSLTFLYGPVLNDHTALATEAVVVIATIFQ
jgi:hypothetical protein